MLLLATAVAHRPLGSRADSQMYKQMESRRLVPTNEDVLFYQNHTEIGLMLTRLHPVSQTAEHIYPPRFQRHSTAPMMDTALRGAAQPEASVSILQSNYAS